MHFRPGPFALLALLAACQSGTKESNDNNDNGTKSAKPMVSATPPAAAKPGPKPGDLPAPPDVAQAPADAAKTESGLATKVLTAGTGTKKPGPDDRVKVHYTGWTTDGLMFDSSVTRGEPIAFGVKGVIKGWTEGLQLMVQGEKRRLWIPKALAYGDNPRRGAPAGDLVFDVEVLEIMETPKPPPVPDDVKEAPKDAKKTASGLKYKILKAGKGPDKPKATDTVTVHYSGWTPDGKMFDTSITTGEPASFRVDRVVKGWTEGLQLLKVGDKARFWLPADLGYGDKPTRPGAPAGPLVFEIELVAIKAAPAPAATK